MNQISNNNEDYYLTLYEVCEILGKSSRTISRYVRKHILHPRGIKSRQGTLEYRFSKTEIDEFKKSEESMRPLIFFDKQISQEQMPVASFADYEYPAPKTKSTFLIPGVSFPTQTDPSASPQPSTPYPDSNQVASQSVPASMPVATNQGDQASAGTATEMISGKGKINFSDPIKIDEMKNRSDEEIISLLKETTGMLRDQLRVKDDQIKNLDDKIGQLIERNRETNILLKGLQDKIMLLEKPKAASRETSKTRENLRGNDLSEAAEELQSEPSASTVQTGDNSVASIKVRISSEAERNGQQDVVSNTAPEPSAYTPKPTKTNVSDLEKKGFFGRFFG